MKVADESLNQFVEELITPVPISTPIPWLTHIFGCWHRKMGRPITRAGFTYRTCMECGAHRKFDMARWKSTGPYYQNHVIALYENLSKIKIINKGSEVSIFEMARWIDDGGIN